MQATSAIVHELAAAAELLNVDEAVVYEDAGYQGITKRPEKPRKAIEFRRIAMLPENDS